MPSILDRIADYVRSDSMPNAFSIYMGKRIREEREAKGYSQEELAEKIYKRRASLSEMENGKMYVDVQSLALLAHYLEKPLRYFVIPEITTPELGDITSEEEELLVLFRQINDPQQRRVILAQIRATAELDDLDRAAG